MTSRSVASRSSGATAIGIGAQKCASSWLHAVAGSHPEIGVAKIKEIDFFSYYFDRGFAWYDRQFAHAAECPVRFESSPSYFYDPRSPERARLYEPDLRVIAILRDPVARAFSNHTHEIVKGHVAPCSFEKGMENNPLYLEQGRYATHLGNWLNVFPRDAVLVLFAEEIGRDSAGSARTLFEFLGVDAAFESSVLEERRNESDRPRIPALRHTLRAGGDWMRRRGLEPALSRVKRTPLISRVLRANSVRIGDEIPPMLPETARALRDSLEPEMAALREMLGRDSLPWEEAAAGRRAS